VRYLQKGKFNIGLDAGVGSCGKGKMLAYIVLEDKPEWATCSFSANAGHVTVLDDGTEILVKQIPTGVLNPSTKLIIGPESTLSLDILKKEIEQFKLTPERLFVSDRAVVVEEEDVLWEKQHLGRIGGTMQGVGAAKARRIRREEGVRLSKDIEWLKPFTCNTTHLIHSRLIAGETFLHEGHQGFGLDISHGIDFPYCTSGGTNTSSFLGGMGVPPKAVGEVIGIVRTWPIRVGNFVAEDGTVGWSGPVPFDAKEVTWADVMSECGGPMELYERTTVTKRVRRVFTWSDALFRNFVNVCGPTQIAVNFIQYIDWHDNCKKGDFSTLTEKSKNFIRRVEEVGGVPVTLVGTGAKNGEIVTRNGETIRAAGGQMALPFDSEGRYYNPDNHSDTVN